MQFLMSLQESAFSHWMRESDWGIFGALIVHTIAMGFLVGIAIAISLRVLGLPRGVPVGLYGSVFPLMEVSFAFMAVSGVLLVVAYPAKAFLNWVFYLTFALMIGALMLTRQLARAMINNPAAPEPAPRSARWVALFTILCWAGTLTSGKLLAHTAQTLLLR